MGIGKLSRRLFLLTLIALIPAAAALFYNLHTLRQEWQQAVRDDALRSAEQASLEIERIISGSENVLSSLSAAQAIQQQDPQACFAYLTRAARQLPQFDVVVVVDKNGKIVCRGNNGALGLSLADRPYVKQAFKTGKFFVGDYDDASRRVVDVPMLPLAFPIKGDDGKTFAVMVAALSLDWLGQRLHERDFARNGTLTVADRNGIILARQPVSRNFVGTKIPQENMHFVESQVPGIGHVLSRDGTRRVVGYYPPTATRSGLYVSAGVSIVDAYMPINRATIISLTVIILSLLTSFLFATLTSTQLVRRPVGKLIATIRDWRAGDQDARTGMSETTGEFGVVGKAIDDFLGELVTARQLAAQAEDQRELLIKELDHRIKNMFATVQSVARQTFARRTLQDQARSEELVAGFIQRLTAMSQAHGLLMRVDVQSAGILDVVQAAITPFAHAGASQFSVAGPDFPVRAKAVLSLSMALHELCTNAVKYGALKTGKGRVDISWAIDNSPGDKNGAEGEVSASQRLRLVWAEKNGPPVTEPQAFGFGSKMIEQVLGYELEATVDTRYAETGVTCTLIMPLDRIRTERPN